MNLSSYQPKENKYIVYQNEDINLTDKLNGVVTTFLLSILNNYNFRIVDNELSSIFTSELNWKSEDWLNDDLYFGRLNLNNQLEEEKHWLESAIITYEIPNADVLKLLINENGLKYIFNNTNYTERLKELDLEYETAYSQLLTYLLEFNIKYSNNYNYLLSKLFEGNGNPLSVHIDTNNLDTETTNLFIDAIKKNSSPYDAVLVECDDYDVVEQIKNKLPMLKIVSLPSLYDNPSIRNYYQIFLQANCSKHIISYWDNMSQVITVLSADDVVIVENKNYPQLKNKVEGYRKAKLIEILDII
jgi:uncharacterized protein YqiB (DUF1249 family)